MICWGNSIVLPAERAIYAIRRRIRKLSYKKLSERVAERFYALLIPAIKAYPIPEPLYCLNIAFDYQYIMPPTIGFGTESERLEWKESYGKRADGLLWNTADYAHTVEIETDNEDTTLFDLFIKKLKCKKRAVPATKLLVACAKTPQRRMGIIRHSLHR